jgi:hypothetical protein
MDYGTDTHADDAYEDDADDDDLLLLSGTSRGRHRPSLPVQLA